MRARRAHPISYAKHGVAQAEQDTVAKEEEFRGSRLIFRFQRYQIAIYLAAFSVIQA